MDVSDGWRWDDTRQEDVVMLLAESLHEEQRDLVEWLGKKGYDVTFK